MNKLTLAAITAAVLVMAVLVAGQQQVQATKELETKVRFPLYTRLHAEDYDDLNKVRITAYYPTNFGTIPAQKISYDIDWKKYDKETITSKILFKPQNRGLFVSYKVCVHNYATDETNCGTGWWLPWSTYALHTLEVPNNYYDEDEFRH